MFLILQVDKNWLKISSACLCNPIFKKKNQKEGWCAPKPAWNCPLPFLLSYNYLSTFTIMSTILVNPVFGIKGLTQQFYSTDLFMTELRSVESFDLCLGFSSGYLLSGLLLGLQHLSLDLLRKQTCPSHNQQAQLMGFPISAGLVSYLRVMLEDGMTSCCLGIGVQLQHNPQVLQRILLQHSTVNLLAVMTK